MNRKINDTLLELIAGIVTAGIVIQIIQLIIASVYVQLAGSKGVFAVGFWPGVILGIGLALHMYRSIDRALDMASEDAEKYMRKAYLLRTLSIFAAAGLICYFKFGYVMAFFLGVLCLKFGAFLQPLMHKVREKFRK